MASRLTVQDHMLVSILTILTAQVVVDDEREAMWIDLLRGPVSGASDHIPEVARLREAAKRWLARPTGGLRSFADLEARSALVRFHEWRFGEMQHDTQKRAERTEAA